MTNMELLDQKLTEANIPHEYRVCGANGGPLIFYPDEAHVEVDAACNIFTYGGVEGLLEIMAPDDYTEKNDWGDQVKGYLDADKAFAIFKDYHESKK